MSFFITFYDTSFQNLTTGGSTCAILYVTYVRGYPPHFAIHTIPYHTSKMPYFCKLKPNQARPPSLLSTSFDEKKGKESGCMACFIKI